MKQDAQWWREYRAKNRERLRTYNTELKRKRRAELNGKPPKTITEQMIGPTITQGLVNQDLNEMERQETIARLKKSQDDILSGKVPLITAPEVTFGKPCKLCGSKLTTEVLFSDP